MHFLFFFGILAIILPNSLSVQPGDPFPADKSELKTFISEDLTKTNEITDPNDDEIPSPSTPLTDPSDSVGDEENSIDNVISTSTKSIRVTKPLNKNSRRKKYHDKKLLLSTTESTVIHIDVDNLDEKPSSSSPPQKSAILSATKSIVKNNVINIGRWKHQDPQTKASRYWYEPEGGRMGTGWIFDGFIFQAYNKSESDTEPVYAFHSEIRSIWTNTVQMDPKSPIVGNDQWISDGVSFYAYKTSLNSTELQPVFRYWNTLKAGATDATETRIAYLTMKRENNNDEDRSEWTYDNILFYALPIKD